jgi:hypothetical protein
MQDAILITRKFGVRYLWIDALCIIHDSEVDWDTEAKRMALIYKHSLLTIAAVANESGETKGCFRRRSRFRTRSLDLNSQWPYGSSKYLFADRRVTQDGIRPPSVLDSRAWVLQEQILSPLVLSYSDKELYWDCIQSTLQKRFLEKYLDSMTRSSKWTTND